MRADLDVALRFVYQSGRLADPCPTSTEPLKIRELMQTQAKELRQREACEVSIDESGYTPRSAILQIVFSAGPKDADARQSRYSLLFSVGYLVKFFVRYWNAYDPSDPQAARIVDSPGGALGEIAEEIAARLKAAGYLELSDEECREAVAWLDPSDTPIDAPVSVFDAALSNA